jgi:hypothetical protein
LQGHVALLPLLLLPLLLEAALVLELLAAEPVVVR